MQSEIISNLIGHSLLGAVLAVLCLATSFWLAFAFRSARSAMHKLTALNQALQSETAQRAQGRAP